MTHAGILKTSDPTRRDARSVSQGFDDAVSTVWLSTPEGEDGMCQTIKSLCHERGKKRKLYLAGHSLGGALATIAAARLAFLEDIDITAIYTIGSPRCVFLSSPPSPPPAILDAVQTLLWLDKVPKTSWKLFLIDSSAGWVFCLRPRKHVRIFCAEIGAGFDMTEGNDNEHINSTKDTNSGMLACVFAMFPFSLAQAVQQGCRQALRCVAQPRQAHEGEVLPLPEQQGPGDSGSWNSVRSRGHRDFHRSIVGIRQEANGSFMVVIFFRTAFPAGGLSFVHLRNLHHPSTRSPKIAELCEAALRSIEGALFTNRLKGIPRLVTLACYSFMCFSGTISMASMANRLLDQLLWWLRFEYIRGIDDHSTSEYIRLFKQVGGFSCVPVSRPFMSHVDLAGLFKCTGEVLPA